MYKWQSLRKKSDLNTYFFFFFKFREAIKVMQTNGKKNRTKDINWKTKSNYSLLSLSSQSKSFSLFGGNNC